MATVSVNGYSVLSGVLSMPRLGAWHADLIVDVQDQTKIAGNVSVVIDYGTLTLAGVAYANRSGVLYDTGFVRVIGGKGGLGKTAKAKYYNSIALKIPLLDLLTNAGESLSATSDAALIGSQLSSWTTIAQSTGSAITALLQSQSTAAWRVLPDGSIWVGAEKWPAVSLDYQILKANPDSAEYEIASEAPTLLPGYNLDGLNVSYVQHTIDAKRVRSRVLVET